MHKKTVEAQIDSIPQQEKLLMMNSIVENPIIYEVKQQFNEENINQNDGKLIALCEHGNLGMNNTQNTTQNYMEEFQRIKLNHQKVHVQLKLMSQL